MQTSTYRAAIILAVGALTGGQMSAKGKHPQSVGPKPLDQIAIEAHIAVAGPVTRFIATKHYDRSYVYAERATGQGVTLIDITNPAHPSVLSDAGAASLPGELLAVAGTAALAGDQPSSAPPPTKTIRLMDFSDPANPKVTKEFSNVSAVQNIGGGIILLADADGIWVLSQRFAEDPEVERRYAYKVVYGESMY
jgi:hypothetical protein